MKQETLEDVVVKRINNNPLLELHRSTCYQFAFLGAKWQSERMYGEIESFLEEVKSRLWKYEYSMCEDSFIEEYIDEWFEQFKK